MWINSASEFVAEIVTIKVKIALLSGSFLCFLFIRFMMISFKVLLTALLIPAISVSLESDCGKWLETGQVKTTNLALTLSVGWNLGCNSVGNDTQSVTLFD